MTAVGTQSKATVMMLPYTPDGIARVGDQITQALLATSEMKNTPEAGTASRKPQPHEAHAHA